MNANLRNFALWVIIVLLLLALFTLFQSPGQRTNSQEISFSQLLTEVDQGRVRDVVRVQSIDEDSVRDASARNLEADVSCIRGVTPDGVILLDVGALLSTDTFREETRSCHRLDRSGD